MDISGLRWQAQFVLWGGMLLFLLSNLVSGQLSAIGQTIWNG